MNRPNELYLIDEPAAPPPPSNVLHLPARPPVPAQPRSVRHWPRNRTLGELLRVPPKT